MAKEDADTGVSHLLQCAGCGAFYPAVTTDDGALVPISGSAGGTCNDCGSDEFEQVTLAPSD